ncbi:style cell-cycle inhibitor 1-A [Malania oleifera]|uniref:style cell-cycle inhibitor 1-A n=1 Tax=Malania oleifera TaxID=397392 RepID=UPI0025AE518A|nr:style cell-cycle inhibitor 1-A [Malania oleifera]
MGSERRSRERDEKKSQKRNRSSPSDSKDGRHSKRHRTDDNEGTKLSKSRNSDRKEKRKDKKSHRRSKLHSDKEIASEKKSDKKHKRNRHKHDHSSKIEFQELSEVDYYSKNHEFATWLKDEKNMFFNELPSESARELFADFVKDWNNHKLNSKYYKGISNAPRTGHNWKIK